MRKQDICNVSLFTADGVASALDSIDRHQGNGTVAVRTAEYRRAVIIDASVVDYDMKQREVVADRGYSQGALSQHLTVARAVRAHVEGDQYTVKLGDSQREKVPGQIDRLRQVFDWKVNDPTVLFHDWCKAMISPDGDEAVPALRRAVEVFGAISGAYGVANGKGSLWSAYCEANGIDESDESDESDEQDESDDDTKVSWQDRMAALVAQAKMEGATPSEILAVVNAALKA